MAFKRLYHSVMCARAALYSAFGSPSFGITWSLVTFLTGLLYLIYDDHKRHAPQLQAKKRVPELE